MYIVVMPYGEKPFVPQLRHIGFKGGALNFHPYNPDRAYKVLGIDEAGELPDIVKGDRGEIASGEFVYYPCVIVPGDTARAGYSSTDINGSTVYSFALHQLPVHAIVTVHWICSSLRDLVKLAFIDPDLHEKLTSCNQASCNTESV